MGIFDNLAQQALGQVTNQVTNLIDQTVSSTIGSALASLLGIEGTTTSDQFNIDTFRNEISAHGEFARPDRFDVVINIPPVLQQSVGLQSQDLNLLCEAAELPSRDIGMIEFRHYGFIKRIPHQNQYGTATFNFILTGDMAVKNLFDAWLDLMVPTNSGLVSYPLDDSGNPAYETTVYVRQFDVAGNVQNPPYIVKLIDAVPTSVGALSTAWNHGDGYHSLPVTFQFRKWKSGSTTANIAPTDFGQASGGNDTPPNVDTTMPNNYTNQNQTPNPASPFPF